MIAPLRHDCSTCPASAGQAVESTRRDFVRNSAGMVAALFGAVATAPAQLAALPIRFGAGRATGSTLSYPVPASDSVTIDRENEIILVRWHEHLYAFALSCPHQRSMLKWREQEQRFQCTKHKSKYTPEGAFISGRATRGMDRYPLRVTGGNVNVDTSHRIEQDVDAQAWNAAATPVS